MEKAGWRRQDGDGRMETAGWRRQERGGRMEKAGWRRQEKGGKMEKECGRMLISRRDRVTWFINSSFCLSTLCRNIYSDLGSRNILDRFR